VKIVLACVATALVVAVSSATAASLITGSQIAPNTIHNHNIHKNTVTLNRLSPGVQKLIKRSTQSGATGSAGATGANGSNGTNGATGTNGAKGDTGVQGVAGTPANQPGDVVYDAVPTTLPANMPSLGFQATSTSELGDYVHLAGSSRHLNTVTVTMSDWALHSTPENKKYPSGGFSFPITLNVYNKPTAAHPTLPGALLGGVTQSFIIPWRPEADPTCPSVGGVPAGTAWRASDNSCNNGLAFNITFNLSSLGITLPDDVIVDVAYSTETHGPQPTNVDGPYDSLNVGLVGSLSAGTDDSSDELFWNTESASSYTDNGGTDGGGVFRRDTNWSPNGTVPIEITATP
jgi:hypothetical protein